MVRHPARLGPRAYAALRRHPASAPSSSPSSGRLQGPKLAETLRGAVTLASVQVVLVPALAQSPPQPLKAWSGFALAVQVAVAPAVAVT